MLAFEVSDLVLLAPLTVGDGATVDVRVTLTPTAAGYALEVRSAHVTEGSAGEVDGADAPQLWVRTAQAQIALRTPTEPHRLDPAAAIAALPQRGPLRTRQHDHLQLGPRWNVTQRVHQGARDAIAELVVPEQFRDDLVGFVLHPAIIDIGLCFAIEQVPGYTGDTLWVPVNAQSVTVYRPDGAPDQLLRTTVIASVSPSSSEQAGFATIDVSFIDSHGRTLVRVEGFTMKRLDGPLNLDQHDTLPVEHADATRPITRSEVVFRHNVDEGIKAAEGADAFERVLTEYRGTEVVVSSLDVVGLRTQMDSMSAAAVRSASPGSGVSFTRPSLDEPYVAPRDAIEETLVGLWQELLGVTQIGVHDSFFDLGGHSLIAVRLFARIRKLFSVDLPISVLFTAQTVEEGAALIRSLVPDAGASGQPATSLPRQYEYLVPMHPNQNSTATPFFLVAGMFGNVLNLRHLANQIGTDRPFYGLQARGLYGGAQPHESFEEMAAEYLREVARGTTAWPVPARRLLRGRHHCAGDGPAATRRRRGSRAARDARHPGTGHRRTIDCSRPRRDPAADAAPRQVPLPVALVAEAARLAAEPERPPRRSHQRRGSAAQRGDRASLLPRAPQVRGAALPG